MEKRPTKTWSDLKVAPVIQKSLREQLYVKPTPIQRRALKAAILEDKNVFGAARTGSGKTLAYAIPLLNKILKHKTLPCSILKSKIQEHQMKEDEFDISDRIIASDLSIDSDLFNYKNPNNEFSCPEAIVLVPTRELAVQVEKVITELCKYTSVKTCCLVGGLSQEKQERLVNKINPEIIIGTPGRIFDLVQSGDIEHLNRESIASIRTLVIDEADRLMQKGHYEEMTKLIDIIKEGKRYRTSDFSLRVYLFSATLVFIHELPDRFKQSSSKDGRKKKDKVNQNQTPDCNKKSSKVKHMLSILGLDRNETKIIDINDNESYGRPSSTQLTEFKINCLQQEKDLYLYYFLMDHIHKRTIVFCNSKTCLKRLSNVLKYLGFLSLKLHADLDQKKRLSSLEKFRNSNNHILIATDVAARGLDIKDLDCVVHYQVPKICESYIHRSGRTARLGKTGISLVLCEPQEVTLYRKLCNNINNGKDLDEYNINLNLKKILKERVDLAQACDKIDHKLKDSKSDRDWFSKAAKACDIEMDDEDFRRVGRRGKLHDECQEEEARDRRKLKHLQKQLNNLLKRPLAS